MFSFVYNGPKNRNENKKNWNGVFAQEYRVSVENVGNSDFYQLPSWPIKNAFN